MRNYYKRLGVEETASPEEIKSKFREHAQALHPDRHPGDKAKEEKFKWMSEAYEQLHKPESRRKHDEELKRYRAERLRKKLETPDTRMAQPKQASSAWQAPPTGVTPSEPKVWSSPRSSVMTTAPVQATAPKGNGLGFLAALAAIGVGVVLVKSAANAGTHWDPTVERRRGRDGRFRRS